MTAEGWWVTTVASKEEALRAAADHAPQLLILDRGMDDPASLLEVFSRDNGGCGVLVLVDRLAEEAAGDIGDGVVARDQEAEDLVSMVRGSLDTPRAAPEAAPSDAQPASAEEQLTARELFGDILVDLGEAGAPEDTAEDSASVEESSEEPPVEVPVPPALVAADAAGLERASAPEQEDVEAPAEQAAPEDEELDAEAGAEPESVGDDAVEEESEAEAEPEAIEDDGVEEESEAESPANEGVQHLAPQLTELDPDVDEPTTDLVEDLAGLLESEEESWPASDEPDTSEVLSIEEVLAVEESVADPEVEAQPEADVESEDEVEGEQTEPESAEPAEALERVGPYELLELVEFGDLTERWLARRADGNGENVVLERVSDELRSRADVRDAFVEGNSDAAGWEHANVLAVVDLGRDGDVDYVATEYRPGHSLREVLDRVARMEARMPLGVSLLLIERIAEALSVLSEGPAASRHGWLVPGSVWLSDNGDVLLREFGLGRLSVSDDSLLRDWTEHRFSAPEKWSDRGDVRSDLYSLGAVLYEMVCGQPVHRAVDFEELVEAIRSGRIARAQQVDPTIPSEIDAWVMRLLRRDPGERPQSVPEVMAKIDLALQALPARPASAELNAYVRQLFAARVPEPLDSAASSPPEETPAAEESSEVEAEETSGWRWDWWWLLVPLLALLSAFVSWKLLSGDETAVDLLGRPDSALELAAAPPDDTSPLRLLLQ